MYPEISKSKTLTIGVRKSVGDMNFVLCLYTRNTKYEPNSLHGLEPISSYLKFFHVNVDAESNVDTNSNANINTSADSDAKSSSYTS